MEIFFYIVLLAIFFTNQKKFKYDIIIKRMTTFIKRITTFIKTKFKISDDRTNIDKYRLAAMLQNIILYQN